ncbi:MAG: PQQ-binding-like beta-propeller repeat protein [Caldilineaceae bacterium]|nr:PQQ-binding-like beta-propeller repeat protein [Caldilineaceae bacterium]
MSPPTDRNYRHDGTVLAIDAKTGVPLWGVRAGRGSDFLPVAKDDAVSLRTYEGLVGPEDAMTGKLLWCFQTEGGSIASLVADEGVIYIFHDDGGVIALLPRIERERE